MNEFSDDGYPVLVDSETNELVPDDHPIVRAIMEMWESTTMEERKAYYAVVFKNSQLPQDLVVVQTLMSRVEQGLKMSRIEERLNEDLYENEDDTPDLDNKATEAFISEWKRKMFH